MKRPEFVSGILLVSVFMTHGTYGNPPQSASGGQGVNLSFGRLVPAKTTMITAWDIPRNPLRDRTLGVSRSADQIRRGYKLFVRTPREAPRFTSSRLSCSSCHLNAGQRELALPLVGVARAFPEYNKREARQFSLEDRIVGCFMRSENATGIKQAPALAQSNRGQIPAYPDTGSAEVVALAAYLTWLSSGLSPGEKLPWRGHNVISPDSLLPIDNLDPALGKVLYAKNCRTCHGSHGEGVQIGDKKAGPLWGAFSWNDGAGAARVYTLAGFIRYAMPYLEPGSLSDAEAQHIAAYINSMPRPEYPLKDLDYRVGGIPIDAVYYLNGKRPKAH